jgi:ABC-2 type transport system ATP-binding protein
MTQLAPFRARLADRLSGGMKQKLALACTLIHEPALIVLDEPTTGVDPVSRREFWKLLSEFLSQGITIVMATPYLDEAERCTRVALLHGGRLLALDRPDALRATLPGALFEVIVGGGHRAAAEALARVPGIADVQFFGERAHVRIAANEADASASLRSRLEASGLAVSGIRPIRTSLEDVFIARLSEAAS